MDSSAIRQVEISHRKPIRSAKECPNIYSNFDHRFDTEIINKLKGSPGISAFHAAMEFIGYIWWTGEMWREQVWRYQIPVAEYEAENLRDLIDYVNENYGDD